jgi:hypothetical protein
LRRIRSAVEGLRVTARYGGLKGLSSAKFHTGRIRVSDTVMSLVTVMLAVSDFVGSGWLVAVICTVAGEGKSAGAV